MNEDIEKAVIFKALSDPKRQKILEILENGEQCACVLLGRMEMAQSTLSYHMNILCRAGLVTARADGKWTYYTIAPSGFARAIELLGRFEKASTERTSCCSGGTDCCCSAKDERDGENKVSTPPLKNVQTPSASYTLTHRHIKNKRRFSLK